MVWVLLLEAASSKVSSKNKRKGLSGGKKFGPPPKKGPDPQGKKARTLKGVQRGKHGIGFGISGINLALTANGSLVS